MLLVLFTHAALADEAASQQVDWFYLSMALFGGLAMFLYGMEQMSDGLQSAAGEKLKDVLAGLTKNRFLGAITGAFVTAVLNSSSVTTVLVVGFISAGFMTLTQSVGVIMGANIGSTFTAQIVAFNVTQYALLLVAVGFFMLFMAKTERIRHYGSMIMGLGLIFYGMGVMGEAMNPMRTYEPFLDLMVKMENPVLGILVGAVFTGLVQSSAATTGIAIVMATEGLISLPAGIALSFGANKSDVSLKMFIDFSQSVADTFDKLVVAIKNNDENAAAEVIANKEHIRHSVDEILKNQASRITVQTNKDLLLFRLELELVDQLRRIYTLTKRVAREFIPDELALKTE